MNTTKYKDGHLEARIHARAISNLNKMRIEHLRLQREFPSSKTNTEFANITVDEFGGVYTHHPLIVSAYSEAASSITPIGISCYVEFSNNSFPSITFEKPEDPTIPPL